MAITKILNIQESDGRNPASHLKNALEYIQNPDKTEECVLVGSINCLPDTAFEQMEETKNIFHKTGKRQGYHVIISFSPEEKVTSEQAMYVLEHFAKDVLGDDYEAVYAVHTDREHMHGHLIWNSVSMTTGKKYNSPKNNWKNHLQPITNKYCDELGLAIMPAEYSRNPKNISRDKWEKEMSMKEIILRDAKMCAYAAGNVEHFKYLMKRLGYVFKKDAWMEVQAPGFRYYHKLAKLDEMFSEETLRHYVDMPWMAKPYFYSSDIRGLHRAKLSPFQKKFYAKLYRLRIVEQKRFVVGGAKYTEDLKRFHQLQDEYLLIVNNDIKSVVDLVDFINEQEEKIQQIEDRQKEIYRESSSRKRSIKNEEQYREYQIWHMEVQEELDELKQEKRNVKRQIQLADDIIKEDLYTAYYAVTGKEEIVADRDVEIPGMEEQVAVSEVEIKKVTDFEDVDTEICREKDFFAIDERSNIKKEQTDVHDAEPWKMDNGNSKQICGGESRAEDDEAAIISRSDDKVEWIADRLSGRGAYENIDVADKAAIFGFDIADISGSISVFTDVMKRLGIKLVGDELYEEFQRIYDESVGRVAEKGKAEDKMWNRGRGR
ncbi:MAG: relaxase/mobilization nuclease domain-containing protein [Lachnospiraceae bacterium]|nr:MAG: relaxase/mobilization nuclease domain-containing protein [Lachnospiraceae bacterium]